ncbi:MAG: CHC2 zinc finger domain-containing protein [bacterium]|nr:CHC2 zinc finger domain-containing protein [bacterium]
MTTQNTAKIFLEQSNDGLVKIFEDKIKEFEEEEKKLRQLRGKEFKKYPDFWDYLIAPKIEFCRKEIRRFGWLKRKVIIYNKEKFEKSYVNVEELLNVIDISEIVENYTKIVWCGKEYRGLCPFHNEKTPSFYVNPEKKLWHCFGCGAGGNVINFLMKIEGWNFKETLNYLKKY